MTEVGTILRADAIAALIQADILALSPDERAELLDIIMLERWDEHPGWADLPQIVREEFALGEELREPGAARYDAVLRLSLANEYIGATNEFILKRLLDGGRDIGRIEGTPEELEPCPCCGRRTLGERGEYQICPVCWWEDDGQDNDTADEVWGGPNRDLSLSAARRNFLESGISDPRRSDLRKLQHIESRYVQGRSFLVSDEGKVVEGGQG